MRQPATEPSRGGARPPLPERAGLRPREYVARECLRNQAAAARVRALPLCARAGVLTATTALLVGLVVAALAAALWLIVRPLAA